jgi:riboflavin synthase
MFTGLIEEVGSVIALSAGGDHRELKVTAPHLAKNMRRGDSVTINGCCLTLTSHRGGALGFDLLAETMSRTNLKHLQRGDLVNLERALAANERFGGHFVQGHVDCVSSILAFEKSGADFRLEVELPAEFANYVASKGSIAINGISLTVAEILQKSFVVWIVPYTKKHTNLYRAEAGDLVNLEFDVLAKYVERMLPQFVKK